MVRGSDSFKHHQLNCNQFLFKISSNNPLLFFHCLAKKTFDDNDNILKAKLQSYHHTFRTQSDRIA